MKSIFTLALLFIAFISSAQISTFPYYESFETGTGDWVQNFTDDMENWSRNAGTTESNGTGPSSASDGSFYLYTEASHNFNKSMFLDASFDFSDTSISSPALNIDYHMFGSAMGTLAIKVFADSAWSDNIWSLSGIQQTSETEAWRTASIDLTSYVGDSNIIIRICGYTSGSFQGDLSIDNISISVDNKIPEVINTIGNIQTKEGFGTYTIDLSGVFNDPDSDTLLYSVSSSNSSITTASISGDTLVLAEIANGFSTISLFASDTSGGTSKIEFSFLTTASNSYDEPITIDDIYDATIYHVEFEAINNYTGSNLYTYYSTPTPELEKGKTYPLQITTILQTYFDNLTACWIDWNQDFDFDDANERISLTNDNTTNVTADLTIPETAKLGYTRMRIRCKNGNESDPYSPINGETEDYTIKVVDNTNHKPAIVNPIPNQSQDLGFTTTNIDGSTVFFDADADVLTYQVSSSNSAVVDATMSGTDIVISEVAAGVSTITITVDDGNSGIVSQFFTFTVNNTSGNTAPTVTGTIDDMNKTKGFGSSTLDLTDLFNDADGDTMSISATSNNTNTVTVAIVDMELTIIEVANGTSLITLVANDSNNAFASTQFNVSVSNTAPVVNSPIPDQSEAPGFETLTFDISNLFYDDNGDDLSYWVKNTNGNNVKAFIIGNLLTISEIGVGSSTITIIANDGDGGIAQDEFVFNVNTTGNNAPKIVNGLPDVIYDEGFTSDIIDLSSVFTDDDSDSIMYSVSSSNIAVVTATVTGTDLAIIEDGSGYCTITIMAFDSLGGTTSNSFLVNVNATGNTAPSVVNSLSDTIIENGYSLSTIDLSDVFTDVDGDNLTLSVTNTNNANVVVTISESTLLINEVGSGISIIEVNASDAKGGIASSSFQFIAHNAPQINTIGNQSTNELVELTLNVSATDDALPYNTLSYSLDASSIVKGMTIDMNSGEFTWTPSEDQDGMHDIIITVTDGAASDEEVITITVNEENVAPVFNSIDNQSINELEELTFTVLASDSDLPANSLTYSIDATSIDKGMSIDANTGIFTWTPSEDQDNIHDITITVTDGAITDEEAITITVNEVNIAPVFNAIDNQSINELEELTFTVLASDSDSPANSLTYSIDGTSIDKGMSIDANTGIFTWTPSDNQGGVHNLTLTVTDGAATDEEVITITVNEVSDIKNHELEVTLNLYPNPVQHELSMLLDSEYIGDVKLEIIGMNGAIYKTIEFYKDAKSINTSISVSELPKATYIVGITQGETLSTWTIIKK